LLQLTSGTKIHQVDVSGMKGHSEKKEAAEVQGGGGVTDRRASTVSFVMTLWLEPQEVKAEPEWRWRVCHVQTGEQTHFRRLGDVLAFVASRSGVPGPR